MPKEDQPKTVATDLPITLYLNQRLTFDLLAMLQGGFSHLETVQTTSSGGTSTKVSGEAQLGASNVFALLGVKLSGQGSRDAAEDQSESTTRDFVHTPASLFAQLRKELQDLELIRYVSSSLDLTGIRPSEFVEFEATLRRSPLIDLLDSFAGLMPLMTLADAGTAQTSGQGGRRKGGKPSNSSPKQNEVSTVMKQIDLVRTAVTSDGSQDLVAELGSMRVVLTTDQDYFVDPSMNDTIDGTFRVFGKATRIIQDDSEKINLLRKSALGRFGNIADGFVQALGSIEDSGFSGSTETEISGPTMQVIPIAIFS